MALPLWLLLSVLTTSPLAGAEPETGNSVAVIYNARLPESQELAFYYAGQRHVPSNQVFGFDLPITEEMGRQEFLSQLQDPLLEKLKASGLWTVRAEKKSGLFRSQPAEQRLVASQIRYAVLCYGVPTKIAEDKTLQEKDLDDLRPELRRNEASVDSQLACLPQSFSKVRWAGPLPNRAYGVTNVNFLHPTNGILLVTRLDGPSPAVARRLVDLAMEAETNGLWGRAYFDLRSVTNANLAIGDSWIRESENICRIWGFETQLDTNEQTFPPGYVVSDVAVYAGWYASHVSGAFGRPQLDFMPGAFAYHLHSFSAQVVRSSTIHWAGPLLQRGATATIGYVNEPYLALTLDLPSFFSRWFFRQFSFGEASWAALNSLSWQSVVIGDPLYCPSRRSPRDLHGDLERRHSPLLAWSHLLVVNRNQAMNAPVDQLIHYLQTQSLTRSNAVMTEKMGDLYWAQKKFQDALDTYDLALQRNPTAAQRSRLLLRLAHLRSFFGPPTQALEYYETFLRESKDYPDKLGLYQKMLALARSAGNEELVARYEEEIKRLSPTSTDG